MYSHMWVYSHISLWVCACESRSHGGHRLSDPLELWSLTVNPPVWALGAEPLLTLKASL